MIKPKSLTNYKLDFVEASVLPYSLYTNRFVKHFKAATHDATKRFKEDFIPNFLYSCGSHLTQRRDNPELLEKIINNGKIREFFRNDYNRIRNNNGEAPYIDDDLLYIDSGGHQICMNYVSIDDFLEPYAENYFGFLREDTGDNAWGFSLDIHADYPVLKDPVQIWDLNKKSISIMLEKAPLDRLIWVYQFRGPGLNRLWLKLQQKYQLYKKFNKFAIGGIAQYSRASYINFPLYMPPATHIIKNWLDQNNSEYFLFHILGVMTSTDIIQFALVSEVANKIHKIPLHVTFDSAKIYRGNLKSAKFEFMIGNIVHNISFKSRDLKRRVKGTSLNAETLMKQAVREFSKKYSFEDFSKDPIYNSNEDGSIGSLDKRYAIIGVYSTYVTLNKVIKKSVEVAKVLVDLYMKGNESKFYNILFEHQKNMNGGRLTRNLKQKCENTWTAVKLLVDLNTEEAIKINDRLFPDLQVFKHRPINVDFLD